MRHSGPVQALITELKTYQIAHFKSVSRTGSWDNHSRVLNQLLSFLCGDTHDIDLCSMHDLLKKRSELFNIINTYIAPPSAYTLNENQTKLLAAKAEQPIAILPKGITEIVASKEAIVENRGNFNYETGVFSNYEALEAIFLPSTLEVIGSCAFAAGCENLQWINLDNVTLIGRSAFSDTGIRHIDFSRNPHNVNLEDSAFCECHKLTTANLGNKITKLPVFTFAGCESLISVKIPPTCQSIYPHVFSDTSVRQLSIPASVKKIWEIHYENESQSNNVVLFVEDPDISDTIIENSNQTDDDGIPINTIVVNVNDYSVLYPKDTEFVLPAEFDEFPEARKKLECVKLLTNVSTKILQEYTHSLFPHSTISDLNQAVDSDIRKLVTTILCVALRLRIKPNQSTQTEHQIISLPIEMWLQILLTTLGAYHVQVMKGVVTTIKPHTSVFAFFTAHKQIKAEAEAEISASAAPAPMSLAEPAAAF